MYPEKEKDERSRVLARWFDVPNWGDALNPAIISGISGKRVQHVAWPKKDSQHYRSFPGRAYGRFKRLATVVSDRQRETVFQAIGSTLQRADGRSVIWGTGFLTSRSKLNWKPRGIRAVRGPLTREMVIKQGIACPEVYGDPALLYPKFYESRCSDTKEYKIGIVPHAYDRNQDVITKLGQLDCVKVIDVASGLKSFIDQILTCSAIASSSLHGIIAADAYGVPSVWIEVSDKVVGNGFKFFDYYASTGTKDISPLRLETSTSIRCLLDRMTCRHGQINLDRLMDVCPFRSN